jgi:hypothetical protein
MREAHSSGTKMCHQNENTDEDESELTDKVAGASSVEVAKLVDHI